MQSLKVAYFLQLQSCFLLKSRLNYVKKQAFTVSGGQQKSPSFKGLSVWSLGAGYQ
jgi:hypothetical protein